MALFDRNRDAPGLDTIVPLETTAAYDMLDVIKGVSGTGALIDYIA